MDALIMMIKNTSTNRFHPIFYFESPLPGGEDANRSLVRYKSKGHHTSGFDTRELAVASLDGLQEQIKSCGYTPHLEIEGDLEWDGTDIPADVQLRSRN